MNDWNLPVPDEAPLPAWWVLILLGAVIATYGAICGVGGGLFATPILHYLFRVPLKRAAATSLALVTGTALSATASEALHADSGLVWGVIAAVVPSALLGAQLGFRVSQRISTAKLKGVFTLALVLVGLRTLLFPSQGEAVAFAVTQLVVLKAAAVGLFAGFVVPLLGVGGGMVLVPGLLLALPDLGFAGARPASLAVASFTAPRSLFLNHRAGNVRLGQVWPFTLGALLGASLGVHLVHLPAIEPLGQVLLGITLLLAALRFGMDWLRASAASSQPA